MVTGLLGLERLRTVRGDARRTTRIGELAEPIGTAPMVYADEQVIDVLKRFEGRQNRAIVREREVRDDVTASDWVTASDPAAAHRTVAKSEAIAGLLTPEDISRAIEVGRMAGGGSDQPVSSPGRGTSEGPVWP